MKGKIINKTDIKTYLITGTFHGSVIHAKSEGEARRAFHAYYNGETITNVKAYNYFLFL